MINFLRWRQVVIEKKIDEKNVTPSDFTVYAMNLPKDKNAEDIKTFFSTHKKKTWEVARINLAYDIKHIIKKLREMMKWNSLRNYNKNKVKVLMKEKGLKEEEAKATIKNYDKVEKRTLEIAEEIEAIKKDINEKDDMDFYCQKAFITFQTQGQAQECIKGYEMWYLTRAFFFVWYRIFNCKKSKLDSRHWEGHRIVVERATEPGDVYWENLAVTDVERFFRQLLTYFVTV